MKLEEVLPHLRAGGKVTYSKNTQEVEYDLEKLLNCLSYIELESDYFEIIKKPYKKEYIVECDKDGYTIINGTYSNRVMYLLPEDNKNKKYKVTIEEITE